MAFLGFYLEFMHGKTSREPDNGANLMNLISGREFYIC